LLGWPRELIAFATAARARHHSKVIVLERPDGIRIIRISSPDEALPYRASFAGAYQDIFSEPPYNERYFPSEAQAILHRYLQTPENICLFAVRGKSKVLGFGIGVPAISKPDIARDLRGLLPVAHTYYLAELGVLESARHAGIGKSLVAQRLELVDHQKYTHVVLRVSAVRNQTYDMYMNMGFDDIGVYTEVHSRRIDGRVSTDRRLFLSKLLTRRQSSMASTDAEPEPFGTGT
jgi:GNAT superfamily N-acetyltransferase